MTGARVLIVGGRDGVVTGWSGPLRDAGAEIAVVRDGDAALRHLELVRPEVVLLDLRLDDGPDGFDTCRALRARSTVPIILAAARPDPFDEVVALAVGADHYVGAGCAAEVLVARVRALVRRVRAETDGGPSQHGAGEGPGAGGREPGRRDVPILAGAAGPPARSAPPTTAAGPAGLRAPRSAADARSTWAVADAPNGDVPPVVVGDLTIDEVAREVHVGGTPVALTRIEFELLLTLARQPRRVFTREQLLIAAWDEPFDGSHVLDTHLSRLRGKVSAAGGERVAHAVRGVGYRLRA